MPPAATSRESVVTRARDDGLGRGAGAVEVQRTARCAAAISARVRAIIRATPHRAAPAASLRAPSRAASRRRPRGSPHGRGRRTEWRRLRRRGRARRGTPARGSAISWISRSGTAARAPSSSAARMAAGSSNRGWKSVTTTTSAPARRDRAHVGALGRVAVAVGAEHHDDAPAGESADGARASAGTRRGCGRSRCRRSGPRSPEMRSARPGM